MILNCVKLVTFMKYLASIVSLIFQAKTLIWNKITFPALKFVEFCRAGKKWASEEYLQKNLTIFVFLFDLSLLNVKISKAYN